MSDIIQRKDIVEMEVLYSSKGISKSAATRKIISIVVCIALMIGLLIFSQSKVEGKRQNISFGGVSSSISFDEYRFTKEERKGIDAIGYAFGIVAIIDAAILGLSKKSWTEIHRDVIIGNFMSKTVSCSVSEITNASVSGNYLVVTGAFGKVRLIVDNATEARRILDNLLLKR